MPDWYIDMKIAEYLGCAPWVLDEMPIYWRQRALVAMAGEAARDKNQRDKDAAKARINAAR